MPTGALTRAEMKEKRDLLLLEDIWRGIARAGASRKPAGGQLLFARGGEGRQEERRRKAKRCGGRK